MVADGETLKSAPLALVPILVPPVDTVYHFMVLPAEVALMFVEAPVQIADGVADTADAVVASGLTVTL